jgi:hypothetical protein
MAPLGAAAPVVTATMTAHQRAAVWVPAFACGMLYTAFFLGLAWATLNPKLWASVKSRMLPRGRQHRGGGGGTAGAGSGGGGPIPGWAEDCKRGAVTVGGAAGAGSEASSDATTAAASAGADGRSAAGRRHKRIPRPVVLSWDCLGCAYNSSEGLKPVLQVGLGPSSGRRQGARAPLGSCKTEKLRHAGARPPRRQKAPPSAAGAAAAPSASRPCPPPHS